MLEGDSEMSAALSKFPEIGKKTERRDLYQ